MPQRNPPYAPVGQYTPFHINALSVWVNTTISAVSSTGSQTVTPASMAGIIVGMILHIAAGGTTAEDVVVTATTGTTFTAVFAFTHSAATACTTPTYMQYQAAGNCVLTSSATAIVAGSDVVVTPASMAGIFVGQKLNIANGTGTAEDIVVKGLTSTTFRADFANNHSGAYTITSKNGMFVGNLTINTVGTGVIITLYNGNPNLVPLPTSPYYGKFATIDETVIDPHDFRCACDWGLFYTVSGTTAGDYTLKLSDMQPA